MRYEIEGLPMWVYKNQKNQKWYLNLNAYRSTHKQSANRFKQKYTAMLAEMYEFDRILFPPPYEFRYRLFFATRTRVDIMNYGSIVDKFVVDALIELGVIKDDNRDVIKKVSFEDGGITPGNRSANLVIVPFSNGET